MKKINPKTKQVLKWLKLAAYVIYCLIIFYAIPTSYSYNRLEYPYYLQEFNTDNQYTYELLILHIVFFIVVLIEIGWFFRKNVKKFNATTHFLADVKEKSKIGMFFLVLTSTIYLFLTGNFFMTMEWIYFFPLAIIHYYSSLLILNSWHFPIHKWAKSLYEKTKILLLLTVGTFSLSYIFIRYAYYIRYSIYDFEIFGLVLVGVFALFIMWRLFSFVDRDAHRYELALAEKYYSHAQENPDFCSNCNTTLNDAMIQAISTQNHVFCMHCGNKIMRDEFESPSEEQLREEHKKLIQKIDS